jgi:hypothetical protein
MESPPNEVFFFTQKTKKIKKLQKSSIYKCNLNFTTFVRSILSMKIKSIFYNIFRFYYDGFSSMTVGKKLWAIIFIKLIIMFLVFKLFFFPNYLNTNFKTDEEKSQHVLEKLTQ